MNSDEWTTIGILFAFVVTLRLLSYWLTKTYKINPEQVKDPCPPHSWAKKQYTDDPEDGTYLVCSKCKTLVGGLREEDPDRY